jgi:hypothetical protein
MPRARETPIGKISCGSGGYTPGDTWDLTSGRMGESSTIYHRGPKKPSNVTTTGVAANTPSLFNGSS